MTREFYNELLHKRLITDNKMTFEYIQEHNLPLCEVIKVPAALQEALKECEAVTVEDTPTIEPTPTITNTVEIIEESTIVSIEEVDESEVPTDAPILDSVEIVETTPVEETSAEIVVDEESVEEVKTTKSRTKKTQEA